MTNRTYAELEKEVLEHFNNLSQKEFEAGLKRARFDYFNTITGDLLMPGVTEDDDPDIQGTLFSGICKIPVRVSVPSDYDVQTDFRSRWSGQPKHTSYKLAA